jgi:predicted DNA-binding transcriptional regulator YafY
VNIKWTGDIVELTELVMAIQETKSINHGNASTIELFHCLCDVLGLDRAACFSHYTNMKRRQNPTKFLDKLKHALLRKIDRDDEKPVHRG